MPERFVIEPANPGEVLACAGIACLAAEDDPTAETGFVCDGGQWCFEAVLPREALAAVAASEPEAAGTTVRVNGRTLDWWSPHYGLNPAFKFWAGQQSARSVLTNLTRAAGKGDAADWRTFQTPTTGRLGVDPQGSWDSLGLGWSVNEHDDLRYLCRPYVELLAFLALQRFCVQGDRDNGFRYYLWRPARLPLAVLAFAGATRHSLGGWRVPVAGSGSNKYLKTAHPTGK